MVVLRDLYTVWFISGAFSTSGILEFSTITYHTKYTKYQQELMPKYCAYGVLNGMPAHNVAD